MICQLALLFVTLGSAREIVELHQSLQVVPIQDHANCDLGCIKQQFEAHEDRLNLPEQHEKYFGESSRNHLEVLMMSMGLTHASELTIHDVTFELSQNNLQLRVIGFTSTSVVSKAFHIIPDFKKKGIRIEHVYSVLEQGHIGIRIGVVMKEEYGSPPDLTLASAMELTERNSKASYFLKEVKQWQVSSVGVAGGSIDRIDSNYGLLKSGAHGFKHAHEFEYYTDTLDHQRISAPGINFLFRVEIPTEISKPDLGRVFQCNQLSPRLQRMCFSALQYSQMKIYNHEVEPYAVIGMQSGYLHNSDSHWINSLMSGHRLTFSVRDIRLGNHWSIKEANTFVFWGPTGVAFPRFGITGDLEVELFQTKLKMTAILSFPLLGAPYLALHNEGLTRVLSVLPIWIGNVQAGCSLYKGALPTGATFGAEINIGWEPTENEDTRLKGMALIDFDPLYVTKSFIYAKFNPITIQSMLNMLVGHSRWNLPSYLGSNGIRGLDKRHGQLTFEPEKRKHGEGVLRPTEIPENSDQFIAVFAPLALETTRIYGTDSTFLIQPGLTVFGQMSLLGVAAKLYLRVNYMELEAEVDFTLDRVSLGNGLAQLTSGNVVSARKIPEFMQNDGPIVYASLHRDFKEQEPEFRVSGAIELFGGRAGFDVELSPFGFHFKTELNIWDWFVAKCIIEVKHLNTSYGIRVYGEITLDSLEALVHGFFDKVATKLIALGPSFDTSAFGPCAGAFETWRPRSITNVKLVGLKFDLDNLQQKNSFPAFAEFEITLFGVSILYKSNEYNFNFDQDSSQTMVNILAESAIDDLEECVDTCNQPNQCCTAISQCQSQENSQSEENIFRRNKRTREESTDQNVKRIKFTETTGSRKRVVESHEDTDRSTKRRRYSQDRTNDLNSIDFRVKRTRMRDSSDEFKIDRYSTPDEIGENWNRYTTPEDVAFNKRSRIARPSSPTFVGDLFR